MWAKFRPSRIIKGCNEFKDAQKSLNLNEEYISAFRTKSYAEFFTKAQLLLLSQPSSSSHCSAQYHNLFSEVLLEPCQETIPSIVDDSAILSKIPELKCLVLKYFDMSAEASNICTHLLKSINQIQSNYKFIQKALDVVDDYFDPDNIQLIVLELNSFIVQNNPFSDLNKHAFKIIHDKYCSELTHLKSMWKRVGRKIMILKILKKACGVFVTAACGLVAITAIVVAAHTLTALIIGPAIFSLPFHEGLNKKDKFLVRFKFLRCGLLSKVGEQLDVAAKGTYILNRDFDTMGRLVARVHDEIEHNKEMIRLCLDRREDKFSLQIVKELKKKDIGFKMQLEELEEHVYLCLVTINRARGLVIKEMKKSCKEDLK